jgi:hypothetical protein
VNLLTKTELFNDSIWTRVWGVTTPSANTINFPNVMEAIYQAYNISPPVWKKITWSVTLSGSGTIVIFVARINGVGYEETTSTITLTSTPTRYSVTHTVVNAGQISFALWISRGGSWTATTITATGAQLEVGTLATKYQKVVTSSDYDTVWFPIYLKCDWVDDGMVTNSIDFTGTNKMTVSSWLRKLSDVAWASIFVEISSATWVNQWTFWIAAPLNNSGSNLAFGSSWSTFTEWATVVTKYSAPSSMVVSWIGDIPSRISQVRVNWALEASSTGNQWTGNYGNYPLYLFRRGGSSLPFNGYMYGLIIRGATTPTATIQKIEKYMNKKVGKIY